MMNFKKNVVVYSVVSLLSILTVIGWSLAFSRGDSVNAANETSDDGAKVSRQELDALYQDVFHRPADEEGIKFHLGKDLKQVLRDFQNSDEQRYYGALFKAVKAYEEARRAPGTLTAEEISGYKTLIDSALSNLLAWVDTLPDQNPCLAPIDSEDAREAIQQAHEMLSSVAKDRSEHGFHDENEMIGEPVEIKIFHPKCIESTSTPHPTATMVPSPAVTPSVTPSFTPEH